MKKKILFPFLKFFASIVILFCISGNVSAQKDSSFVTINGGIYANSTYKFPNTKDHDFSVRGDGNQRTITMHNNIKSGKYVDDIMVSIAIPDKGAGEYKFTRDTNPDNVELGVTVTHNLNDNAVYYHMIGATEGVIKITSVEGKSISGTFELAGEETNITTIGVTKYTLKGNFKAVKIN